MKRRRRRRRLLAAYTTRGGYVGAILGTLAGTIMILLVLRHEDGTSGVVVGLAKGWDPEAEHPCTVRRLSWEEFQREFVAKGGGVPALYPTPLVIRAPSPGASDGTGMMRNERFRNLTSASALLERFPPDFTITLSSSNALSEHRRTVPLSQYLQELESQPETTPHQLANESWYLFGETYTDEWKPLLRHYELPPCTTCIDPDLVALAFGIGNRGSGVQWHQHGPGFSEALHGRKHWVLYKPDHPPHSLDKDESSRMWMERHYPSAQSPPLECTLNPGDLIYFPDRYWHATVNLDPYTAFVSSFTTEHKGNGAASDAKTSVHGDSNSIVRDEF